MQDAILAGVDPSVVKDAINGAQAEREAARAEVESVPTSTRLEAAEVYAMIDALGDVCGALERAQPDSLIKQYRELGIEVSYQHRDDGGVATIALRVVNERVRGGELHVSHNGAADRQPNLIWPVVVPIPDDTAVRNLDERLAGRQTSEPTSRGRASRATTWQPVQITSTPSPHAAIDPAAADPG